MRNVYHKKQYFRINGGEWERSGYGCIKYVEDDFAKENTFKTKEYTDFEEICKVVDDYVWNSETKTTIFGNRVLRLWNQYMYENFTYSRKEVKTFELKEEYVRRDDFTIKELSHELKADDFCAYLKDRGVQNIVISQLTKAQRHDIINVTKGKRGKRNAY